jgi:hypothetical protein
MKITGKTSRYIAIQASVAQADTAFDTTISEYITTVPATGSAARTAMSAASARLARSR